MAAHMVKLQHEFAETAADASGVFKACAPVELVIDHRADASCRAPEGRVGPRHRPGTGDRARLSGRTGGGRISERISVTFNA